ncbi:MAG: OsmC family protein [Nitrospirota bacterium]
MNLYFHALTSCLTTSMIYHAAARGIKMDSIESRLEGDLDLQGFLGLPQDVRPGYENLRVQFTVKSDAPAETLRELTKHSPAFDIVTNSVPVAISVNRKGLTDDRHSQLPQAKPEAVGP